MENNNFSFDDIREGNEPIAENEKNSIVNVDGKSMIMDLTSRQTSFCSMKATTKADKIIPADNNNYLEFRIDDKKFEVYLILDRVKTNFRVERGYIKLNI